MEEEPVEFYERVCEGYRALAKREPDRFVVIDAAQPPDAIENEIWNALSTRLPSKFPARNTSRSDAGREIRKSKI
jgi:dTMP kinase